MPPSRSRPIARRAYPALIAGNAALAFGPLLVRLADTGPVAAGFWRLALGLPLLLLLASGRRQWSGAAALGAGGWALLALAGLAFAIDLGTWHLGIVHTRLANATLFGNASSLLLPLWSMIATRSLPRRAQMVALLLAMAGGALMMGRSYQASARYLSGDLLCIVAGIFYTVYLIALQRVRQGMGSWAVLAASTAASVTPMLLFAALLGERIMPVAWTPLLILALTSQVVGQGLMVYAIGYFSPLVVGLALLSQPAIAALVGALIFGERLAAADMAGMTLVAAALVLIRLPDRRSPFTAKVDRAG